MEEYPRFSDKDLRDFAAGVFESYGVPAADSAVAARVLIETDLMGVDSHGIAHLAVHPGYCPGIEKGIVNPKPSIRTVHESATTALVDGDGGMGVVAGPYAMELAMAKAEKEGAGFATVTNSRHFGMLGCYALMATERDMLGVAATNTPALVVPAGGAERMLGTNPIAVASPAGEEPPFMLDIATSVVAGGKLEMAMLNDASIPTGWALDKEGRDTTDPRVMYSGGSLLPLGSTKEMSFHKGYGLAVVVDIVCGVLSGVGYGAMLSYETAEMGGFFGAIRIDGFRPVADFKGMMDEMVRALRKTPPADGFERVLVPGESEYCTKRERLEKGIPLHPKVVADLEELGKQTGVAFDY